MTPEQKPYSFKLINVNSYHSLSYIGKNSNYTNLQ